MHKILLVEDDETIRQQVKKITQFFPAFVDLHDFIPVWKLLQLMTLWMYWAPSSRPILI